MTFAVNVGQFDSGLVVMTCQCPAELFHASKPFRGGIAPMFQISTLTPKQAVDPGVTTNEFAHADKGNIGLDDSAKGVFVAWLMTVLSYYHLVADRIYNP